MNEITILCIIILALTARCIYIERKIKQSENYFKDKIRACENTACQAIYRTRGIIPECKEDFLNLDDEVTFTLSGIKYKGWIELTQTENPDSIDLENPFEIAYFCENETKPRRIRLDFVKDLKLIRHNSKTFVSRFTSIEEIKENNLL